MGDGIMIINGDSLEVLKTMDDNSVDSVVTDPPYGLSRVRSLKTLYLNGFNQRSLMVSPVARAIDTKLKEKSKDNE